MANSAQNNRPPIRLLMVDDEKGFADVLAKRLSRRNILTVTAYNGDEGIREMMKAKFDVALLDLKMEGMGGIELLSVFKKMDPDLPVIMLTGHGSEQASREGRELGAYDYLSKPYDLELLAEKIEAAARDGERHHG
jgi:DNA-binding response OmpR family regulator